MENLCDNMTRQRDAPYPKSSIVYISLTLNVIRGHWRSLREFIECQNQSKGAKNVKIHPGLQFLYTYPYNSHKYYELYHSNLRGN